MSRKLLLVLSLAVALIAGLVQWQSAREERGDFDVARPLFEDLDFERVSRIHITSVSRGSEVGLQRGGGGAWYLVDPVAYRADTGLMELLRQALEGNLALTPPNPNLTLESIGLAPPQAELRVTESVDGAERERLLLLGDADATGNRVYALQDGELLLTSRNLVSTLDKEFTEFRSRRISELDPASVYEVHRTGRVQHAIDDEAYSLELSAWRDGGRWRSLLPVEAALDPMDISLVSVGAGRLSFEVYIEEPDPDLSTYGLDDPEMRIELKGGGGAVEVLNFSRPGVEQPWFCMRDGSNDVFKLSSRDAVLLTFPFEAMIDLRLVRVDPADIDAVRLERPGGLIRLERAGEGWVVSEGGAPPVPAEALAVRTLLAWIADAELAPFEEGATQSPKEGFDRSLILDVGGADFGGVIGGAAPSESGQLRWYKRIGDDLAGKLDAEVVEWVDRPVSTWWSLSLLEVDELEVSSLALSMGDTKLRYARGERGRWRDERGREASELLPWLDPLLFLRATERGAAEGRVALDQVIQVRFELSSGEVREFSVGLNAAGGAACTIGPVRADLLRADLHEGLAGLFR